MSLAHKLGLMSPSAKIILREMPITMGIQKSFRLNRDGYNRKGSGGSNRLH